MPQFNEGNINSYLVPSGSLTGSLSNSGTLTGQIAIGSGGGTTDYNDLTNKPSINSVTLSGNKTTADLNISYNDLDDKPVIPAAQVNSDWNAESGVAEILNKPTIPTELDDLSDVNINNPYQTDVLSYDESTSKWINHPVSLTVEGLSNVALSTPYAGEVLKISSTSSSGTVWRSSKVNYSEINNTPTLATVATSGDYDDLTNKPTIPAAQVNSDWNAESGVAEILNKPTLATVATSGDYDDLTNKPTIPNITPVDVTSQITITKNSGNWTVDTYSAYRSGNVVTLYIRFASDGTTVNAGSNAFKGNVSSIRPLLLSYGSAYISSSAIIAGLWPSGGITVRVTGANITGTESEISITYITNN